MPDVRDGSALWSEQYGVSESCADCGGAVPTMEEHDIILYDDDGLQRCANCSEQWNSIGQDGQDITP